MISYKFRVCWMFVILASSAASAVVESTQVLFRNTGLETVFIVTDIGPDKARQKFSTSTERNPIHSGRR